MVPDCIYRYTYQVYTYSKYLDYSLVECQGDLLLKVDRRGRVIAAPSGTGRYLYCIYV